eukprot:11172143-Lingulodinium_polyedra.AAC.1
MARQPNTTTSNNNAANHPELPGCKSGARRQNGAPRNAGAPRNSTPQPKTTKRLDRRGRAAPALNNPPPGCRNPLSERDE